jgi:hypothetical protein
MNGQLQVRLDTGHAVYSPGRCAVLPPPDSYAARKSSEL